jgi:hypothetical protein
MTVVAKRIKAWKSKLPPGKYLYAVGFDGQAVMKTGVVTIHDPAAPTKGAGKGHGKPPEKKGGPESPHIGPSADGGVDLDVAVGTQDPGPQCH